MLGIHWVPTQNVYACFGAEAMDQLHLRPPEPIDEALFVLIVLPSASHVSHMHFDRQTQALSPTTIQLVQIRKYLFLQMYSVLTASAGLATTCFNFSMVPVISSSASTWNEIMSALALQKVLNISFGILYHQNEHQTVNLNMVLQLLSPSSKGDIGK